VNFWCDICKNTQHSTGYHAIESDKKVRKLTKQLEIAVGALKSCVGYEPFKKSLEPRMCTEALSKIDNFKGE
jgi:hypothetical protein